MQQEPPSCSHLRLRVLDGGALPVQEAILGVDHLLGLAGLLKSRFQLQCHVLAHCGAESTGRLEAFSTPGDGTAWGMSAGRRAGWRREQSGHHPCPKKPTAAPQLVVLRSSEARGRPKPDPNPCANVREAGRQSSTCGNPSEPRWAATHGLIFEEEEKGSSCTTAAPRHIPPPPHSTEASHP